MTQDERNKLTREANMRIPGTTPATLDCMVRLCELNDAYIDAVIAELPKTGTPEVKAWTWGHNAHECEGGCNHQYTAKGYTPRQISDIERAFRAAVGSAVVESLLDDEALWIALAAGMDNEGAGSPLPPAREFLANASAKWAYDEAKVTWDANFAKYGQRFADEFPFTPTVTTFTADTAWLNELNRAGYSLVRDKIKLEYLPRIKEIIGTQAAEQVPWNQIASNLRKEMQFGKRWDWVRLVRTEMKHSSYIAQMEQNKAVGVPFVKWSTSRAGATCETCEKLNQRVFKLNLSTDMLFTNSDVDLNSDKIETCPPPPHPQCRCVQIPVWGRPKVQAPRTPRPRIQRIGQ